MSYVDELTFSLVRVLDHATFYDDIRMVGYAANLDFWIGEIRHCLDCIQNYESRQRKLIAARKDYLVQRELDLDPILLTPATTPDELRKLENRVTSAAKSFLRKCCKKGFIEYTREKEIEQLLGFSINMRRSLD
ncbi:MAG: hypothetical protein AAGA30_17750 [Planctomycetota bacterium]